MAPNLTLKGHFGATLKAVRKIRVKNQSMFPNKRVLSKSLKAACILGILAGFQNLLWAVPAEKVLIVKHPEPGVRRLEPRNHYFLELVSLALTKAGVAFEFQEGRKGDNRAFQNIRRLNAGLYDVSWMHTDAYKEQMLTPIRIPMFKGMIGWRVMLVSEFRAEELAKVRTKEQLATFTAGLVKGWPDVPIMEAAGFPVHSTEVASDIPLLVKQNRVDIFPRAINEVWDELPNYLMDGVVLDQSIALYYPSATYLFVAKKNKALASLLEQGLNKAIDDGSFDELFNKHFGEALKKANLDKRHIIRIDNPNLPSATPLKDSRLWIGDMLNL